MSKTLSGWQNSTSNWRIIAVALEKETHSRSRGDAPSEDLTKAVTDWAGEQYMIHFESLLKALDELHSPACDREQCMDAINAFVHGGTTASDFPLSLRREALEASLGL